jgi:hypothetical protein
MKKLLLILAAVLLVPALSFALSLTVSATTTAGQNLGPHRVLECTGYSYVPAGNPWTQCSNKGAASTLNFGILSTRLKKTDGTDDGGAGCFYGEKFFIVYLYPDAWGGAGYDLRQATASFTGATAIQNAVVMTPVYSKDDKFVDDPTAPIQGILNDPLLGITGEAYGPPVLARKGGRILMARRPRIVRAEYGIPPYPAAGDPNPVADSEWKPVQLNTATGTYTTPAGSIVISITPI